GLGIVYLLVGLFVTTYLRRFGPYTARLLRTQIGLFVVFLALMGAGKVLLLFTDLPDVLMPAGVLSLWFTTFVDRRASAVVIVAASVLCASLAGFDVLLLGVLAAR